MNRFGAILVMLLFSYPAFARQGGPRNLAGQTDAVEQPQPQAQAPLERSVAQLYLSLIRNDVELTDEQFLRAAPVIQQFIRQKFANASQKNALDERQKQLLSQPNASEADFQKLNEEATRLNGETSTWEGRMARRLQNAMGNPQLQLSERQLAALSSFNKWFFTEKLPTVVEQARVNAGGVKRQQQRPAAAGRPNQNRKDQTQPGDTLRGKDAPPVQPRPKLSR
jgi:hypothetical protein